MPSSVLRALRHPAFLGALVVLVVNDHLLKGSGVVPAWLTGKLSDFAGLIVAPVVLWALVSLGNALLGRREPSADAEPVPTRGWHSSRLAVAATGMVVAAFVATELWQPAADLVAAALGALGVASRLCADPTDLVALAILPVTVWVLAPEARPERHAWSPPVARAVLAGALIACVATAPRAPGWTTTAYLVNGLDTRVDVRLRWAGVDLACADVGERSLSSLISSEDLTSGLTLRVEPGATIPLDDWAALAARGLIDAGFGAPRPPVGFGDGCVIGMISIDGVPDTLVFWSTATPLSVPTRTSEGALPPTGRVEVALDGEEAVVLRPSADVRAEPFDDRTMAPRCALAGEVATSDPASFDGPAHEVVSRTDGPDGCVRLDFAMGTRPAPFFVCAPAELVPFGVGDVVRIDASDERGVRRVALTGEGRTLVLLRSRANDASRGSVLEGGVTLSVGEADACGGDRIDCGSFVVPHAPTISGASAGEDPRGTVLRTSTTGRSMRIRVTRAEAVIAASPRCAEGREAAGPLLDAVVLYE